MNKDFSLRLEKINSVLAESLNSPNSIEWKSSSFGEINKNTSETYINELIAPDNELMNLGGKRWRPLLLSLTYDYAKSLSGKPTVTQDQCYSLMPLVEFVHTASLIQDDIEDKAELRRGKKCAYLSYGLDKALNSSSWLYFQATECLNNTDINSAYKLYLYELFSRELRTLHLGQAMDIYWHNNPEIFPSTDEYYTMVTNKTGTLSRLACMIGCSAGGFSEEKTYEYGKIAANIGIGFQIIDDVINLDSGNLGKNKGDDIVEGKKSLPVILHFQKNPDDKAKISKLMKQASKEGITSTAVAECINILASSGSIDDAKKEGVKLIKENCKLFNYPPIEELFNSMIPESYK